MQDHFSRSNEEPYCFIYTHSHSKILIYLHRPFFFFSLRSMLERQTPPSLTGIPFTEAPYQLEAKCKTDQLQHAHHLAVGKISTTTSQKRPKGEPLTLTTHLIAVKARSMAAFGSGSPSGNSSGLLWELLGQKASNPITDETATRRANA